MPKGERKLTIKEASEYTGFSIWKIRRDARDGYLTYYRTPRSKTAPMWFTASDLDEWVDDQFCEAGE